MFNQDMLKTIIYTLVINFKKPLLSLAMINHIFSNLKTMLFRTGLQMKTAFQTAESTSLAGAFENKAYVSWDSF